MVGSARRGGRTTAYRRGHGGPTALRFHRSVLRRANDPPRPPRGLAALGAGLLGGRIANAQVSQAYCGNMTCAANPGVCRSGCARCVFGNGNSRCMPPGSCTHVDRGGKAVVVRPIPTGDRVSLVAGETVTDVVSAAALPVVNGIPQAHAPLTLLASVAAAVARDIPLETIRHGLSSSVRPLSLGRS